MSGAHPSSRDRNDELLALVADLEVIQRRILDLTNGQIDAVVQPSGILSLLPAAQESLRQREAEQRAFAAERAAILDAIPAQIALLNETGQILAVNKQWLAFGCVNDLPADYSSVGKNYLEICEGVRDGAAGEMRALAEGIRSVLDGRTESFSVEYPCPTGHDVRWFQLLVSSLGRDVGRGAVAMHIDITTDRAVREELRHTAARLNTILDNLLDGIITLNEQGIIESLNPATARIFGYAPEDLLGRNVAMLMPADLALHHDGFMQRRASRGGGIVVGFQREVEGLRADGSRLPLELGVTDMQLGDRHYYVGILRDITERKRLERLQSEFVSTASHELRTPLASILGAIKLVMHGSETLPPAAAQLIGLAERNAERLDHLVNDIFDAEKLASGQIQLQLAPLALHQLAARCLEATTIYATKQRVQLQLDSASVDGPMVHADGARLRQALMNLVANAVKFSPPGATVRIRVREQDGWGRVEIEDRGSGIPQAFRDRIFQRFAQADGSHSRSKGGSGLGLHIAKGLIECHQGRLDFRSEPGRGSTFWFELPIWRLAAPQDADHAPQLPDGESGASPWSGSGSV